MRCAEDHISNMIQLFVGSQCIVEAAGAGKYQQGNKRIAEHEAEQHLLPRRETVLTDRPVVWRQTVEYHRETQHHSYRQHVKHEKEKHKSYNARQFRIIAAES